MKTQCSKIVEVVESYTLENKGLLIMPKKYKIEKDSDTIFVF